MGSACQLLLQSYPSPCSGRKKVPPFIPTPPWLYQPLLRPLSPNSRVSYCWSCSEIHWSLLRTGGLAGGAEAQKENTSGRHNLNAFLSQMVSKSLKIDILLPKVSEIIFKKLGSDKHGPGLAQAELCCFKTISAMTFDFKIQGFFTYIINIII